MLAFFFPEIDNTSVKKNVFFRGNHEEFFP